MATNQNKTVPNSNSVDDFIAALPDERRRGEARELVELMQARTGCVPTMWGESIVGFGSYHYKSGSGREGDFFPIGFSPRKAAISLYVYGYNESRSELLARLGPHRTGRSCIYVTRLNAIDRDALADLIDDGLSQVRSDWP
ncbi:DUF1801 domain-containing protein [Hoyosella rhizosphaerae]|uniref:YdhG-like domain-containing protein n=1 Tax=Hoyosella rhizosphaerae TaxID=1755582 RepID=A0A916U1Z4_9ACTN|nr:DUF1801 domain-containing protein [Hoyosella rhizosphaerae]GGC57094.1 hypothetical protein GCM10011410_07040 [Hoyosella rhizosphaerae]